MKKNSNKKSIIIHPNFDSELNLQLYQYIFACVFYYYTVGKKQEWHRLPLVTIRRYMGCDSILVQTARGSLQTKGILIKNSNNLDEYKLSDKFIEWQSPGSSNAETNYSVDMDELEENNYSQVVEKATKADEVEELFDYKYCIRNKEILVKKLTSVIDSIYYKYPEYNALHGGLDCKFMILAKAICYQLTTDKEREKGFKYWQAPYFLLNYPDIYKKKLVDGITQLLTFSGPQLSNTISKSRIIPGYRILLNKNRNRKLSELIIDFILEECRKNDYREKVTELNIK
ncbi:hypothetical protein GXP67_12535 [Rhodocytophaga rosea]|uniref:Uncharacterized protein n=1 Tax=Rhodocytophaga rosea TaxID=2704465 RepID=A0A6C0GH64_9BACT|nr:hypothetical protein [Rhodocytophaga rosea]QHT67401.1 hypothetical protein GXP67_12535 [Rhodocytophaga rosea]